MLAYPKMPIVINRRKMDEITEKCNMEMQKIKNKRKVKDKEMLLWDNLDTLQQ